MGKALANSLPIYARLLLTKAQLNFFYRDENNENYWLCLVSLFPVFDPSLYPNYALDLLSLYTATLFSRSASLRLVFRSVLSFLWPMINAQGTWYSPAGKDFVMLPGITTLRGGT